LWERKAELGLSDACLDHLTGLTAGHTSKVLGPARVKGLSRFTIDTLSDTLGVSFLVVIDPEKVRRMSKRWERRSGAHVNIRRLRVSKAVLSQAQIEVLTALGRRGGTARAEKLTKEQRSAIARAAANAMHAKRRAIVTGKAA